MDRGSGECWRATPPLQNGPRWRMPGRHATDDPAAGNHAIGAFVGVRQGAGAQPPGLSLQIALSVSAKSPATDPPNNITAMTVAAAIRPISRPYSTDVAPCSGGGRRLARAARGRGTWRMVPPRSVEQSSGRTVWTWHDIGPRPAPRPDVGALGSGTRPEPQPLPGLAVD